MLAAFAFSDMLLGEYVIAFAVITLAAFTLLID